MLLILIVRLPVISFSMTSTYKQNRTATLAATAMPLLPVVLLVLVVISDYLILTGHCHVCVWSGALLAAGLSVVLVHVSPSFRANTTAQGQGM